MLVAATDRFVFDMPEVHTQHLRLLALMNETHARGDYYAMGTVCHRGIALRTSGSLWTYNLACALSLQDNPEEALEILARAVDLGFHDLEHIKADSDLEALRERAEYKAIITRLEQSLAAPDYTNAAVRRVIALPPQPDGTVVQGATNTLWSFSTGLFHTFLATENSAVTNAAGVATPILVYANRDNGNSAVPIDDLPGVARMTYSPEVQNRRLHIGAPNTLLIDGTSGRMMPVIGNSSLGFVSSAYWRSQPRAVFNDPELLRSQVVMLLANQLYCYPAYSDYSIAGGDLFTAYTPYCVTVAGDTGAETPFVRAIAAAVCALPAATREQLVAKGMLMPVMQMLLRRTLRGIETEDDYLSGAAHAVALLPQQLDSRRFVEYASRMTTNDIPPLAALQVEDITALEPALDMPLCVYSELLFETHLAVCRIFRAFPYRRRYKVTVLSSDPQAEIRGGVLQGLPGKIRIERSSEESRVWLVDVAHHEPFHAAAGGGDAITTMRVDIGFFAAGSRAVSPPALLSIAFLGNEKRVYDEQERLLSIDYRRNTAPYTDPLLSYMREWKDVFRHDSQGRIIGWERIRSRRQAEQFTAYGDLAVAFDAQGRATQARRITYMRRYESDPESDQPSPPSLAQVDDNIAVNYTYASDDDFIGTPDACPRRMLNPPGPAEPGEEADRLPME